MQVQEITYGHGRVGKLGALNYAFKFARRVIFGKIETYAFIYADDKELHWETQVSAVTQAKLKYGLKHLLDSLYTRDLIEKGIQSGAFNPTPLMIDSMERERLELLQTYVNNELKKFSKTPGVPEQQAHERENEGAVRGDRVSDG